MTDYIGTNFNDTLVGGVGDDWIFGEGGDDKLTGGGGNDIFVFDIRGFGQDTITDFNDGDRIVLSALHIADFETLEHFMQQDGDDVVITLGYSDSSLGDWPDTEVIRLQNVSLASLSAADFVFDVSSAPLSIQGTVYDDVLFGANGNDTLDGGDGGYDVAFAGGGNDYIYHTVRADGGAGVDTLVLGALFVHFGFAADLQSGEYVNIENVSGTEYDDVIRGSAANNALRGGRDNDVLSGRGGADRLDGGDGVDTASYWGETVGVTVDLSIGKGSGGNAQGDVLISIENLNGSNVNDTLIGNAGANSLSGYGGQDALLGGAGNDALAGGAGKDTLTGGAGTDRFVFAAIGDSVVGANADRITDFRQAQNDRVDLSALDANTGMAGNQAFTFIGTGLYTHHAGELRYASNSGQTTIAGDVDGDGTSDFHIILTGAITLQAADFVL